MPNLHAAPVTGQEKTTRIPLDFESLSFVQVFGAGTMASDDDSKPATKRMTCTLGLATIRYLELLSREGTHGTDVPDVMKGLIEIGVRQAITEGWIRRLPSGG